MRDILSVSVLLTLSVGCANTDARITDKHVDEAPLLAPDGRRVSLLDTPAAVRPDAWYSDRHDRSPGAFAGYQGPTEVVTMEYTTNRTSGAFGQIVDSYRTTRRTITETRVTR